MNKIVINKPYIKENSVICDINFLGKDIRIVNEYSPNKELSTTSEGFVSLFLPHVMFTGDHLVVKGGVSNSYLKNINLLKKYYESLNIQDIHLNLDSNVNSDQTNNQNQSLCTFTGGVDSFYTLISNFKNIDSLLFCIDYDVKKNQKKLISSTLSMLDTVSKYSKKELIICKTNQRRVLQWSGIKYLGNLKDQYKDLWGLFLHGPCLFNHGYNLSNNYGSLYIPSSHPASSNYLWGSSFHIDHLHSSSLLDIIHDGDCSRTHKVKTCLCNNSDLFLSNLRVCYANINQSFNCSKCEKCTRTILAIGLLHPDSLNNLSTFNFNPSKFDEILKNYITKKFTKESDIDFQNEIKHLLNLNHE